MSEDRLERAFRALRAEPVGRSDEAPRTLERVLSTNRESARKRRRAWRFFVPLAAVLVASTAWAGASGRLTTLWNAVSPPTDHSSPPPPTDSRVAPPRLNASTDLAVNDTPSTATAVDSAKGASEATPPSSQATPDASRGEGGSAAATPPSASSPMPIASSVHEVASLRSNTSAIPAPSSSTQDSKSADTNPLALDKADFETAFRAHGNGAPAAAVEAWDQYLAHHPTGRFVPEARYARAVALVRAGQIDKAKEALRPFVESPAGSYRHDDAVELLESLSR